MLVKNKSSMFWSEQPVQTTQISIKNKIPTIKKLINDYNDIELNKKLITTQKYEKWSIHDNTLKHSVLTRKRLQGKFVNFIKENYSNYVDEIELIRTFDKGIVIFLFSNNTIRGVIHFMDVQMKIDNKKYKFGYTDYLTVKKGCRNENVAGRLIAKLTNYVQYKYKEALPTIYSNHKSLKRDFSHFLKINSYSLEINMLDILISMYYQKNPTKRIVKSCNFIRNVEKEVDIDRYLKQFRCTMILNRNKFKKCIGIQFKNCLIVGEYKNDKKIFEIKFININTEYEILIHCLRTLSIYLKNEGTKLLYFNDFGKNYELKEIIPFKKVSETYYYFYNLDVSSFYPNEQVCFL